MNEEKQHLQITVRGRVQGVFFRDSTKQEAERLGIGGFVQNNPDGAVYIEAEGTKEQLDSLIEWLKSGPEHAHVKKMEVKKTAYRGARGFKIKR